MDLPLYYSCPPAVPHGTVSQQLLEECIEYWSKDSPLTGHFSIPAGWSNDWSQFRYLNRWVLPSPRWGHLDPAIEVLDVQETTSATIRYHLDVPGDVKPVLYRESDHVLVLFRVGQRLFLHRLDELDQNDRMCALPLTLQDVLRVGIDHVVREGMMRHDCSRMSCATPATCFRVFSDNVHFIEDNMDVFEEEGQLVTRPIMQTWDDEKWLEMLDKVSLTLQKRDGIVIMECDQRTRIKY